MKRLALALCILALALPTVSASALDVGSVKVPDTKTVDGKALKLNGAGIRKKAIFKVYVAGLYVETTSKDASALLASSEAKSMQLWMLRDIKGSNVSGAIADGFQLNSKAALPQLQP